MKEIYLIPILAAGLPMGALAAYQGVVYADRNANGQRDAGEVLMKDVAVSDGLHVVKTNGKGEFELPGQRVEEQDRYDHAQHQKQCTQYTRRRSPVCFQWSTKLPTHVTQSPAGAVPAARLHNAGWLP